MLMALLVLLIGTDHPPTSDDPCRSAVSAPSWAWPRC